MVNIREVCIPWGSSSKRSHPFTHLFCVRRSGILYFLPRSGYPYYTVSVMQEQPCGVRVPSSQYAGQLFSRTAPQAVLRAAFAAALNNADQANNNEDTSSSSSSESRFCYYVVTVLCPNREAQDSAFNWMVLLLRKIVYTSEPTPSWKFLVLKFWLCFCLPYLAA